MKPARMSRLHLLCRTLLFCLLLLLPRRRGREKEAREKERRKEGTRWGDDGDEVPMHYEYKHHEIDAFISLTLDIGFMSSEVSEAAVRVGGSGESE